MHGSKEGLFIAYFNPGLLRRELDAEVVFLLLKRAFLSDFVVQSSQLFHRPLHPLISKVFELFIENFAEIVVEAVVRIQLAVEDFQLFV